MKRALSFALAMLLLFSGCRGERETEEFRLWRQQASQGDAAFHAQLLAALADGDVSFEADVRREQGELSLTLTAPESLAGVTLHTGENGTQLHYDGAVLALGTAAQADTPLSPARAIPTLLRSLSEGRLLYTWREGEQSWGEVELSETLAVRLCRDAADRLVYAELLENGKSVIFCTIENWTKGES